MSICDVFDLPKVQLCGCLDLSTISNLELHTFVYVHIICGLSSAGTSNYTPRYYAMPWIVPALDAYFWRHTSPYFTLSINPAFQIHTGLQNMAIYFPQRKGLPLKFKTLADRLLQVGYSTNMIGKWHIGFFKKEYTPNYRGFQNFFGGCHYFKCIYIYINDLSHLKVVI